MPETHCRILDSQDPRDLQQWLDAWAAWPQREVLAHPHYCDLYTDENSRALCALADIDGYRVLYPFIMRDLTVEDYWPADVAFGYDLISPYGYGGPFVWNSDAQPTPCAVANAFWASFGDWAAERNVVSEFIRFSLFPEMMLPYPGERETVLTNIVRNLDLDEEAMFMDFEHKVRKNVKKAQRNNVQIVLDSTGERLDEYLDIYEHTMSRRQASERYYFPRSYYESIHEHLAGQFVYFHALHEGRVISTELVLISAENVYSFLGGTSADAFDLRPNDLLKYEIINWARTEGKRRFILGGGYHVDDGVYRYKLAFAPHGIMPFDVGRRILNPQLYDQLVANTACLRQGHGVHWSPAPNFFPAYRA